jgi:hypothetical protein
MENFMNPGDELTDKELDGVSGGDSGANLVDPTSSAAVGSCMMALLNDTKDQQNDMRAEMNGASKWFVGRRKSGTSGADPPRFRDMHRARASTSGYSSRFSFRSRRQYQLMSL